MPFLSKMSEILETKLLNKKIHLKNPNWIVSYPNNIKSCYVKNNFFLYGSVKYVRHWELKSLNEKYMKYLLKTQIMLSVVL